MGHTWSNGRCNENKIMYGDFRKRILIVGENRRDVRDWLGLLLVADIVAMPVEDVDSVLSTTFDVVYKLLVDICEYDGRMARCFDGFDHVRGYFDWICQHGREEQERIARRTSKRTFAPQTHAVGFKIWFGAGFHILAHRGRHGNLADVEPVKFAIGVPTVTGTCPDHFLPLLQDLMTRHSSSFVHDCENSL